MHFALAIHRCDPGLRGMKKSTLPLLSLLLLTPLLPIAKRRRRRTSETMGYGRDLLKSDSLNWKAKVAGGLRQSKFLNNSKAVAVAPLKSTDIETAITQVVNF